LKLLSFDHPLHAATAVLALVLGAGCVSYQPLPLDERALLLELQGIRLDAVQAGARVLDLERGLSRDEAVAVALYLNPELRAARRQGGVAEGELVSAGMLSNPVISASWMHIQDFTTDFASGLIDLGLDWVPPRPGELDARKALAQARIEQVQAEISALEWRVAADVRKAHLRARIAAEQLRLAEASLALQERVRQFIREKRALGDATDLDASLADVERASALQGRELAAGELERARQELNALLGLPPLAVFALDHAGEHSAPDLSKLDPARLEALMLEHRPGIASARSAYRQAEQRLRLACLASWPWFSLGLRFERDAGEGTSSITKLGAATNLDLPILDQNQGAIASLTADRDRLREAFRAEVHLGRAELNAALRSLRAEQRLLAIHQDSVQPALDENARLTESGVALGEFNFVQLVATQDKALRTQREFLAARLEFAAAAFELERSIGMSLADLESNKE
jgi:outer membrane protein, heavy metal efflux system